MRIVVSGASGLIGSALVPSLREDGHEVLRLVRRTATGPDEIAWDPANSHINVADLEGTDAIVHLAGAGVGDKRWSDAYKKEILDSRVLGTCTLANAAASLDSPPSVFVSGSAMGYYGDRGDEILDESASKGTGFLADVVQAWEAAAAPAVDAGIRVPFARTGLVVSENGGAWQRLIKQFKLGAGGRLGSGNQYWSFISLRDEVRALRFLIDTDTLAGPVNLVSPNPVTNRQATEDLAELLHRPAIVHAPAFALKLALGEFSSEVLSSARVNPALLTAAGFSWNDPTMTDALRACLPDTD